MQSSSNSSRRFQSSVTSRRTRLRGEFLAAAESSSFLSIQFSCTKQVPLAYVLEPPHLHELRTSQSLQKRNRADRVLGWVTKKGTRLTEVLTRWKQVGWNEARQDDGDS
uniref:(northern house mosquito) hypothetical protein n=1 Tax=Culex pipiens TaxID=7175 RepID=A0A8D8BF54_CULPI